MKPPEDMVDVWSGRRPDIVNVYDVEGRLVATRPRGAARAGARKESVVTICLVDTDGRVVLRLSQPGGVWDRTASGQVDAGDTFDSAAVRLAGASLFGDTDSPHVALVDRSTVLTARDADLPGHVIFHPAGIQLDTREEHAAEDEPVLVTYETALYLGRTGVPANGHASPPSPEGAVLHAFRAADVDRLLTDGLLAPGMASLWVERGWELLAVAGVAQSGGRVRHIP